MKKVKRFQLKTVIFTAVKYRCILHGNVYVMVIAVKCLLFLITKKDKFINKAYSALCFKTRKLI